MRRRWPWESDRSARGEPTTLAPPSSSSWSLLLVGHALGSVPGTIWSGVCGRCGPQARPRARRADEFHKLLLAAALCAISLSSAAGDGEELLAQAVGLDADVSAPEGGIEHVLDLDGLDDLDLDDSGDGPHGQREVPSMEDVMAEERVYFLRTDSDGDDRLDKHEFVRHFLESIGDFSVNTTKEDLDQAAFSFEEFDLNSDAFVDWEEWAKLMFHDGPQEPEYRDGNEATEQFPSAENKAYLTRLFRQWDSDIDGRLSKVELKELLRGADGMMGTMTLSDDEIDMITWQLLEDGDTDKNMHLSLEEWIAGGGNFA